MLLYFGCELNFEAIEQGIFLSTVQKVSYLVAPHTSNLISLCVSDSNFYGYIIF